MALALDVQGLAAVAALAEARKIEKAAAQAAKDAADAVRELLGDEREGRIGGVVVVVTVALVLGPPGTESCLTLK